MDTLPVSAQLNAASNHSSCLQASSFPEPDASGEAFSRDIVEAVVILCAMRTDAAAKKYLQQPALPFDNPFDDTRLENRSIASVGDLTKEDQLSCLPAGIEPLNNDHAPTYIPGNECFSIQSILGLGQSSLQVSSVVDNNRSQKSDESCSLPIQRQGNRYQNDPDYAARVRARRRERYHNDPDYAARARTCARVCRKKRYRNDPDFAERERNIQRERQRELRKDPDFVERERERQRKYRMDPDFAERKRERQRMRRNNTFNMKTATFKP